MEHLRHSIIQIHTQIHTHTQTSHVHAQTHTRTRMHKQHTCRRIDTDKGVRAGRTHTYQQINRYHVKKKCIRIVKIYPNMSFVTSNKI